MGTNLIWFPALPSLLRTWHSLLKKDEKKEERREGKTEGGREEGKGRSPSTETLPHPTLCSYLLFMYLSGLHYVGGQRREKNLYCLKCSDVVSWHVQDLPCL